MLDTKTELVWSVPGFFDEASCAKWIALVEAAEPEVASVNLPGGARVDERLRNNTRVIRDDVEAARALTEQVRPHVPAAMYEGAMVFAGVNERLRFYRYAPGQRFGPHYDGSFARDESERSLLTFMVYLNTPEAGGETDFLDAGITIKPNAGDALFFQHRLLHEGSELKRGLKYVLRSDVMYRRA